MSSKEHQIIAASFPQGFRIHTPGDRVHTGQADDVKSINVLNDNGPLSPFVFSSPHSGRIYPTEFIESSVLSALQLRSSEDAYVDELFAHVTNQGGHLIHALFPRAYLDLNRQPFELDPKLFVGQLPPFAKSDTLKVKSGLGVIARIVSEGREIYRKPLDINDALTRINRLYYPYHGALRSLLRHVQSRFSYAVLIDCHSMPSSNIPGFKHMSPDFVIGDRFSQSCSPELGALVYKELQDMGYVVSLNKPYAGGYVTKEYGKPNMGVHALQIEINRRLYLDEKKLEKTRGFDELQKNLQKLTATLIETLPDLLKSTPIAAE